MMGRCQGGYCQMRVAEMIEKELGIPKTELQYARKGSYLFTGCLLYTSSLQRAGDGGGG